jgi:hypothetical protein
VIVVMLLWKRVKSLFGFVDTFPPQIKSPINETAFFFIDLCILDDDCPSANSRFAPAKN